MAALTVSASGLVGALAAPAAVDPVTRAVVSGHDPIGRVDALDAGPGALVVSGWALDPDNTSSIQVTVALDGQIHSFATDAARPDVGAAYPGYGDLHGFSALLTASPGDHRVCVTAVNSGPGSDTSLGCPTVHLPGGDPYGTIDIAGAAQLTGTDIRVAGWVIDPEAFGPTQVAVYIDDQGAWYSADRPRDDVAAAYPGVGNAHGYDLTIPATAGTHQVCAYGINIGTGANALLACRTVTVPRHDPFGTIDTITIGPDRTFAAVAGWSVDPDTIGPTQVAVYVGAQGAWYPAVIPRDDVAAAFPDYGPDHGFNLWVPLPPGAPTVTVCAYGINTGPGANALLACHGVTIPATGTIHGTYRFGFGSFPKPARGSFLISGGNVPGWSLWGSTASDGSYAVDLIPGSYHVGAYPDSHLRCSPYPATDVDLAAGMSATVDITCVWIG